MIEFDGYISGEALKYFWKKGRYITLYIFSFSLSVLLPAMIYISWALNFYSILIAYSGFSAFMVLLILLWPNQKDEVFIPKKVFTDNEHIVVIMGKHEEFRLISDATVVKEYDEFYFIEFPFGQKSGNFVCQKSLLTKGTLEEFEALFPGKIERHTTKVK